MHFNIRLNIHSLIGIYLFFLSNALFANLRAPWAINRYPSYPISYTKSDLVVLKENLEFHCDKVYEGDGIFSKIIEKQCKVEAIYFIQSKSDVNYELEFVLPSEKTVFISTNESLLEMVKPVSINVSDLEKEGYRLSDLCKFCNETINHLYSVQFKVKFKVGENKIHVAYQQPLATSETSYGYFQKSKWMNSFTYDLWPLREWKLDSNFEMKIQFNTEAGSALERFFSQKLISGCRGIELRFIKFPGAPFKREMGINGSQEFYNYNQNLNPNYDFTNLSKTYFDKDKLVYELILQEKFPDRLNCFFGHDRN